jgi:N-acetylmuramoyl-L-alanine amidase
VRWRRPVAGLIAGALLATAFTSAAWAGGAARGSARSVHPDGIHLSHRGAAKLRPPIVWHPFGYGARRRAQMAAYSRRHYGTAAWRLTDPHVVVEHYTAGTSVTSVFNYYAANGPHLGELPGVCAHFVIDTDGTIYQEAPLSIRCRHAIGMNQTAIGIEHVGTSDAQVLRNAAEMRSSLRLTLWLMATFRIQVRNVIGHAETLMSPFHHEAYPSWRCLTHADWLHRDMQTYRTRLRRRARAAGVPVGPPPAWVDPRC